MGRVGARHHSSVQWFASGLGVLAVPEEGTVLPANTSLDIGCFTLLVEANLPKIIIQRFYEFGYFQSDSIFVPVQLSVRT